MSDKLTFFFELLSLSAFLIAYKVGGLLFGTKVLMISSLLSISLIWATHKKVTYTQIITVVIIQIMGGITLISNNSMFIKMKPTIVYSFMSISLFIGVLLKKHFIKTIFEKTIEMDETKWKNLTIAWSLFFAFCALLNEIVWRNLGEEFWVTFKVFAFLPMTVIFLIAQLFILRNHIKH